VIVEAPKEPDGLCKVADAIKDTGADQVQALKECAEALAKPDTSGEAVASAIRASSEDSAAAMSKVAKALEANKPEVRVTVPASKACSYEFTIQRDSRGLITNVIAVPI
jgi:hypothetical protein